MITNFFILINLFLFISFQIDAKDRTKKLKGAKMEYIVQEQIYPKKLNGISEDQIKDHWSLYKGYVENVNKLNNELKQLAKDGKSKSLEYADRRRRYGFEYNGMVLHEYYFANLKQSNKKETSELLKAIEESFGTFENWLEDFKQAGKTRGIGWVILVSDPFTKKLINIFVADHENGQIVSFAPILVMDIWEHAFMVDYYATEKGSYIDAFINNINWDLLEQRYNDIKNGKVSRRF